MAKVHIASAGAPLSDGLLQLQNGDAMDATLRPVTDQNNTASPLELSTGLVSVSSTLQIATNDVQYIDAEDTGGNNRFTVSRAVGSQTVNVDFASNPTLGTDQVGAIRTYQDGVSLSDAIGFQKNGQVTFTERVKIEADSTSTTQSAAVIQSTTTNAGLVLQPNGTGAIMAQVPDGTIAGGNARGQYAVDLQMVRSDEADVAGGDYSVILGGQRNKTSIGAYNAIVGGYYNKILGSSINGAIAGGDSNTLNASYTTISGGRSNVVSSQYSTISGGQSNTASTHSHATVVGGSTNTASGQYSVAGGYNNVASGTGSVALGTSSTANNLQSFAIGTFCTASGLRSFAQGQDSQAIANYSRAFGYYVKGYLYGQTSFANFGFNQIGDAQQSLLTARKQDELSSAATTVLSLDGTGTTNLIIPEGGNRAWNVTVKWVAVITADGGAAGITVGDTIASTEQLLFKKVGGVSSVVGTASTLSTHSDASMASCSMAYTAGASQELALTFTGPTFVAGGPVTCRIVAKVELTEVAW